MKNIILAFFLTISFGAFARAGTVLSVLVDTSSLSGSNGNLDFQFNPANAASQSATALISLFSTNGTLGSPAILSGDVTPNNASLPVAFTLGNSQIFNDL